jgi:hypothetical protein
MSLNLNSLTAYVEQKKLPIIRKAVIGNKSAQEFYLMTGVKGATALNLLTTDVKFGDGTTCGWNEAGTSTMSQRTLTPGAIKVNMSFCDKAMLKYWMNYDVKVAAGQKTLPFEEDFINGVIEGVQANLEKAMWQGDTTSSDVNLKAFDGLLKTITNATGVIKTTFAEGATITSIVNDVYSKLPSAVFSKGEVVIYMGSDSYRKYIQELIANGNLVITNALNDVAMPDSILVPGTNVRAIGVAGLDNTDKFVASYKDNFVYGVDMQGDEEKAEMWYSQDNREFRLAIEFIAGVNVAYPDAICYAEEQQ